MSGVVPLIYLCDKVHGTLAPIFKASRLHLCPFPEQKRFVLIDQGAPYLASDCCGPGVSAR